MRCFLSFPGQGAACFDGWAPERADLTAFTCCIIHTELSHWGSSQGNPKATPRCPRERQSSQRSCCLPTCPLLLPTKAFVRLMCGGDGYKCRQLPTPVTAPLRLGNLLRVFEPRQPKVRKVGAALLSRLLPSDSWSLLVPSSGSIPMDGLTPAAATACPCLLWGARAAFPSGQGTDSSPTFRILKPPTNVPRHPRPGFTLPLDPASRGARHSQPKTSGPKKQVNTPRTRAAMPGMLWWAASQKRELLWQCGT